VGRRGGVVCVLQDPFLFCVYHKDNFPKGEANLGPARDLLRGRHIGSDFSSKQVSHDKLKTQTNRDGDTGPAALGHHTLFTSYSARLLWGRWARRGQGVFPSAGSRKLLLRALARAVNFPH